MKTELAILTICGIVIGMQAFLGGEEAYKYVNPYVLWWMKFFFAGLGGGALVMKAFMSRTYGDDQDEKAAKLAASGGMRTVTSTEVTQNTTTVTPASTKKIETK